MKSEDKVNRPRSGRALAGLVLIFLGATWMAHEMGLFIPDWILSPYMIPIAIGIFIGAKRMFRPGVWMLFVAVGILLIGVNHYNIKGDYFWPLVIILFGLWMIVKPKGSRKEWDNWKSDVDDSGNTIDVNSVFGGTKKKIVSKDFKGGEVNSVFGGNDLDFSQADIIGNATLDLNVVFGGAKLIVPSHWKVQTEVDCVFGSVEDKRKDSSVVDDGKTLILKGSVVFGGIEIKSY
jgi:predicted membrane protein